MPEDLKREELAQKEGQYAIRKQTDEEKLRNETPEDIPQYRIRLKLSQDQKEQLTAQFKEEFDAIVEERNSLGLPAMWTERDRQYHGEMRLNNKLPFNLHVHQSKIKEDAIVRALNEAFLESEPMVDVSPRPNFAAIEDKMAKDVCDKQSEFIDFAMDEEIKPERDITLINHDCVRKYVGIGKIEWNYKKEKRKREEVYEGKNEIVGVDQQGQPIIENKALKEFLGNYPDAQQRYATYVKQLMEEKTVNIVVEYLDTITNCPKLSHIKIENFYVKNSVQDYDTLRTTHFVGELQNYTWFQLQDKVRNEEFDEDAVDLMKNDFSNDDKKNTTSKQTYMTADYDVIEATMYFDIDNKKDSAEEKIKAWFAIKAGTNNSYVFLGAILYPYFGFDIDYIPFHVKLNTEGFYGGCKSVVYDLKDSNIAQDALLNLSLASAYKRNILTPIVKEGSDIADQFLENRWTDGRPITVDALDDDVTKAVSFVEYPQFDLNQFMGLAAQLKKIDSDVSGVSDLMTGRESPTDPRAPASKTIALLNQSGINIKDYIRIYLPSFNIFIGNVLQLYYQMSQEGRKFKVGALSKAVTGDNPFQMLSRDEMVARTSIQSRAASFAFDKMNEKQENLAMHQIVAGSPLAMVQPDLVYKALKMVMKTWSPAWKLIADNDLMSQEEFKKQLMAMAMQGLMQLYQQKAQAQQVTGVTPQTSEAELMQSMTAPMLAVLAPQQRGLKK